MGCTHAWGLRPIVAYNLNRDLTLFLGKFQEIRTRTAQRPHNTGQHRTAQGKRQAPSSMELNNGKDKDKAKAKAKDTLKLKQKLKQNPKPKQKPDFVLLDETQWDGTVLPQSAEQAALRRDTLVFFQLPRRAAATPACATDAVLPAQWAPTADVAAMRARVASQCTPPQPPVHSAKLHGAAFATAQQECAQAARACGARMSVRTQTDFVALNKPALVAVWSALIQEPRQWMFAGLHEMDLAQQALDVATALVHWAYDSDGVLCMPLLQAYWREATEYTTQWCLLSGHGSNAAASGKWHEDGADVSVLAALYAYAAFLQTLLDAAAPGLLSLADQARTDDALRLKKARLFVKRGIYVVPGTRSRQARTWWWGELLAYSLGGFLTAYSVTMRAHLRMLALVPKDKAPPRLPNADVYGYGPDRQPVRTLEHTWHVYLDAMTLLHYLAPHFVHLLHEGRVATLLGYMSLMERRWAGDACLQRAVLDLTKRLRPTAHSLLESALADLQGAVRRVQVLLSVAGTVYARFASDAVNETSEELAVALRLGKLHPLLEPTQKDVGGRTLMMFAVSNYTTLEQTAQLLNHPGYGTDAELSLTLVPAEAAALAKYKTAARMAHIMRYTAALLQERVDVAVPWNDKAEAFMTALGVQLPSSVTRALPANVSLMAMSRRCTNYTITMDLRDAAGAPIASDVRATRPVDDDRTSVWDQLQARDVAVNTWARDVGKSHDFVAAAAALAAWTPPEWLEVTASDGKDNAELLRKHMQAQEEMVMNKVLADVATSNLQEKDKGKGKSKDKSKEKDKDACDAVFEYSDTSVHVWKSESARAKELERHVRRLVATAVANEMHGIMPAKADDSTLAQLSRLLTKDNLTSRTIVLNLDAESCTDGLPTRYMLDGRELRMLQLQARMELKRRAMRR